ncbi:MAG: potassium channel family protein [Ardenticatenaceae bacterium]
MLLPSNRNGQPPKHVVIMGCGRIGASIAKSLADQGCTIAILDLNPHAFERLSSDVVSEGRIKPITGDGTLEYDLHKASIADADVFIAVSDRDTRNALAAHIAQQIFEIPTVISRMNDPHRKELYNQLGIITISGTTLMTEMMLEAVHRLEVA